MTDNFKIVPIDKPEESAWGIIGGGLSKFNIEKVGDNKFQRLCYAIKDS